MRYLILLFFINVLSACASNSKTYKDYFDKKGLGAQLPETFQHCHGYGCKFKTDILFKENEWNTIKSFFVPLPKTPEHERELIKQVITFFEQRVGQISGTENDIGGTFRQTGKFQLDCVDESTNTTIYISLLQQQGLLQFHKVEAPQQRLPIIHSGRWPHQSAVISENNTNQLFVVDSWFHNNGVPPEIVHLNEWREGWRPEN